MLSKETIDNINDLPLEQIIRSKVELKKSGSGWEACSPFTEEKTPSFKVSPAMGVWKCFSTGKGGNNGISFIMACENCSYIDAIKIIADANNIPLVYDDSDRAKAYIKKTEVIRVVNDINAKALEFFESCVSMTDAKNFRYSPELIAEFRLGYAPETWDSLCNFLTKEGFSKLQIVQSGLAVKKDDGGIYDFFRGRIIFPVFNLSGKLIGFNGRNVLPDPDKKIPKYLNSKTSDVFSKSDAVFALFVNKQEIIKKTFAIKVEGCFDVIGLYSADMKNAVAPLGTAFTKSQAEQIRKHTDTIIFFVDNDAPALKTVEKDLKLCVELGFFVKIFIPGTEGADADEMFRAKEWIEGEAQDLIDEQSQDAIIYQAKKYFEKAESLPQKSKAESDLAKLIALIPQEKLRNDYIKELSKEFGIEKKSVEKEVSVELTLRKSADEDEPTDGKPKLPSYLDKNAQEDFQNFMFYEEKTKDKIGYWFPTGSSFSRETNFLINPLFQIKSRSEGYRILELVHADPRKSRIMELPVKAFSNPGDFENLIGVHGDFRYDGTKKQLQKIRAKLFPMFPMCEPIRTLGWHKDGFWSFSNGIVDAGFKVVDSYGIVTYNEKNYFLPAFSKIYEGYAEEEDDYSSERKNVYRPSQITMREWSNQMKLVYQKNGMITVAFAIAALFRDFIHGKLDNFPMLFGFGRPLTGKTTCARSLSSVFFTETTPFNLHSGTVIGFQRRLSAVKNAVVHLDEYHNNLDEKRFQSLKGIYDGTGHEAGVKSNDNRTKVTKINSAAVITGQYLPTRDDNSLYTRSILMHFTKTTEEFTQEEKQYFQVLGEMEAKGLSALILEIVKYRDLIEDKFESERYRIESELIKQIKEDTVNGRVVEIFAVLLATFSLVNEQMKIAFSYKELEKICVEMIIHQSSQIETSNTLSTYFKMIEYMSSVHLIAQNVDYVVETVDSVRIRHGKNKFEVKTFTRPTRVLFLRMTRIHPEYLKLNRQQTGENGVSESSIMSYVRSSKTFIGNISVVAFGEIKTSAYAFFYDEMEMSLHGIHDDRKTDQTEMAELKYSQEPSPAIQKAMQGAMDI